MNSQQEEIETPYPSRRKRIGRVAFLLGIALIVIGLVSSLLISVVSAYSGSVPPTANFEYIQFFLVISGIMLMLAGIAAVFLPEGFSKDAVWSMETGPIR
ncbi:MAG: hypothetical protein EAX87_13060 [Candidatus Thorarchaeota archaeon]|nr:hypothetical protein [Candidatus Thorarchaeota archaeon]